MLILIGEWLCCQEFVNQDVPSNLVLLGLSNTRWICTCACASGWCVSAYGGLIFFSQGCAHLLYPQTLRYWCSFPLLAIPLHAIFSGNQVQWRMGELCLLIMCIFIYCALLVHLAWTPLLLHQLRLSKKDSHPVLIADPWMINLDPPPSSNSVAFRLRERSSVI